jgi:hypothetical protein
MKNRSLSRPGLGQNNSGQAMVEYILLLVISVVLVTGLMLQFSKPLQFFIKDYMGNYVQCLLDTGELPDLNSGRSQIRDTSCLPSWDKATANAVAGNGADPNYFKRVGDGRSGTGKSRPSELSNRSSSNDKGSGSKASSGEAVIAGSGPNAGSASRNGRSNFNPTIRQTGADGNSGQNDKVTLVGLSGTESKFFTRNIASAAVTNRKTIIEMSSLSENEKKKIQSQNRSSTKIIALDSNQSLNKKILIKPQDEKIKALPEEKGMTFGNYLRIIFIICIIILLVILLGGQALQISKGWQK